MRNLWMALLWAVLLTSHVGARAEPPPSNAARPLRGVLSTSWSSLGAPDEGHTVALDENGSVWSWGNNKSGQLGDGTTRERALPAELETIARVKFIDTGARHTVALRENGTVWTWGNNRMGQLGRPASASEPTPRQVPGLTDGVAVEAGGDHSLMLRADGTVWSWGNNTTGQLGRTTSTSFDAIPAQVPGLTGVVTLSAGFEHTLALRADGTVWAWGSNRFRELGFPEIKSINPTPRQVPALTDVTDVAAGMDFSLARRANGSVWSWGIDPSVQMRTPGNDTPQRVDGPKHVIALTAGVRPLVMEKNGTLWGWGWNYTGVLGTGSNIRSTPARARDLSRIVSLATGFRYVLALREDGTVWGWGNNLFYEISPYLPEFQATPSQVTELPKVVAIAGTETHSLAVAEDGTVWGWGDNSGRQFGPLLPTSSPVRVEGLSEMVAVKAGPNYSLALREDGTVWGMGINTSGQLGWPRDFDRHPTPRQVPGITGVVALSTGHSHVLALREDGTVWAWGDNTQGVLGVPESLAHRHTPAPVPGLTDVVAISAQFETNLVLRGDGTVWAWGSNAKGQLGDGTFTSRYTPAPVPGLTDVVGLPSISNGLSLVLRRDGTVWGFGRNTLGVLSNTRQEFFPTPVQIPALGGVKDLAVVGEETGVALLENGTVWAWGGNSFDQIGDGVSSVHRTAVKVRLPCRFTAMTSRDHRAPEARHCPAMP